MSSQIKEVGTDEIKSGDWVDSYTMCPVHNTKQRKDYGFGRYRTAPCPTAWVTVYSGCQCATCVHGASLKKIYFSNWNDASSEARFTVQRLER
jgi:hypothetical protein